MGWKPEQSFYKFLPTLPGRPKTKCLYFHVGNKTKRFFKLFFFAELMSQMHCRQFSQPPCSFDELMALKILYLQKRG